MKPFLSVAEWKRRRKQDGARCRATPFARKEYVAVSGIVAATIAGDGNTIVIEVRGCLLIFVGYSQKLERFPMGGLYPASEYEQVQKSTLLLTRSYTYNPLSN